MERFSRDLTPIQLIAPKMTPVRAAREEETAE